MLSITNNGNYKTTTRYWRNNKQINTVLALSDVLNPHIFHIWPWWIVKGLSHLVTSSKIGSMIESWLRKTWLFSLESYETQEIHNAFEQQGRKPSIVVTDIELKVIQAVRDKYPDIEGHVIDITKSIISDSFDVIFCNNVLQRMYDWSKAVKHIHQCAHQWTILGATCEKKQEEITHTLRDMWWELVDTELSIYQKNL